MSGFIKESLCTVYKLGCSFTTHRLKQLRWFTFSPPPPRHPLVLALAAHECFGSASTVV